MATSRSRIRPSQVAPRLRTDCVRRLRDHLSSPRATLLDCRLLRRSRRKCPRPDTDVAPLSTVSLPLFLGRPARRPRASTEQTRTNRWKFSKLRPTKCHPVSRESSLHLQSDDRRARLRPLDLIRSLDSRLSCESARLTASPGPAQSPGPSRCLL
jgi:hypothetical protein